MKKKSRTWKTMINTAMGCAAKFSNIFANFVMRTFFIYCLGAEYNGVASLFTDILQVLSFAELGIASAITFELYRPISEEDKTSIAKLMGFYQKAYRLVALIIFSFGIMMLPFLDKIIVNVPNINESLHFIYILYLFNTAVSYLLIYKSTLLIASQKKYVISYIEISVVAVRTIVQIVVLFLTHNYICFLVITIVSTVVQNLIISYKVDKEYPYLKRQNEKLEKDKTIQILKDVKALSLYKICGTVTNGMDSIFISVFSGTVQVGFVANYKLIMSGIQGLLQQFFLAAEPGIGSLVVETDEKKQYSIFELMNTLTFWVSCVSSTMFIVLYSPFVRVWIGQESVLSMNVVVALVLNFYIAMMMCPVASFRTGNGLFVQGQYRPVAMLIFNLVFSAYLGKIFGVFGVLIATVIARLLSQVWFDPYLVYSRVFKISCKTYFLNYIYQFLLMSLISLSAFFVCSKISLADKVLELLLKGTVCFFYSNIFIWLIYRKNKSFIVLRKFIGTHINGGRKKWS